MMKHLRFKPKKIIRVGKEDIDVTEHYYTTAISNQLYVKAYKNGVKIRMRGQSEIVVPNRLAGDLALMLRELSYPKLYTSVEVGWIINKFKHNREVVEFVKRILDKEVKFKEIEEIKKFNDDKDKILNRLSGIKNDWNR